MKLSRFMRMAAIGLVMVGVSSAAHAQSASLPAPEFSAGYQFTHAPDINLPAGWYADIAWPIAMPELSIVGEVSGAYHSESVFGVDVSSKLHIFMAGARYSMRTNPKLVPYGEVLFGIGHSSVSPGDLSSNDGVVKIGAGANAQLADKFWVRAGVGFQRVLVSGSGENDFTASAGVVIPLR